MSNPEEGKPLLGADGEVREDRAVPHTPKSKLNTQATLLDASLRFGSNVLEALSYHFSHSFSYNAYSFILRGLIMVPVEVYKWVAHGTHSPFKKLGKIGLGLGLIAAGLTAIIITAIAPFIVAGIAGVFYGKSLYHLVDAYIKGDEKLISERTHEMLISFGVLVSSIAAIKIAPLTIVMFVLSAALAAKPLIKAAQESLSSTKDNAPENQDTPSLRERFVNFFFSSKEEVEEKEPLIKSNENSSTSRTRNSLSTSEHRNSQSSLSENQDKNDVKTKKEKSRTCFPFFSKEKNENSHNKGFFSRASKAISTEITSLTQSARNVFK